MVNINDLHYIVVVGQKYISMKDDTIHILNIAQCNMQFYFVSHYVTSRIQVYFMTLGSTDV